MTAHYYADRFAQINLLMNIAENIIIDAYKERISEKPIYPDFNDLEKNILECINQIQELTAK